MSQKSPFSPLRYLSAWLVHLFTASAAFIGVITLYMIHKGAFVEALWLMAIAILVDAVDGTLARLVDVKKVVPRIDGALLDNMIDYFNYVLVPCFFMMIFPDMLPDSVAIWMVLAITITSSYQFTQADAKTADHFFKGFPCYWNIVVFYMVIFNSNPWLNTVILSMLCIMIFIPVKYVYPSRLDYLTESNVLKRIMHGCSLIYGVSSVLLLANYPHTHPLWLSLSLGYVILYVYLSIYRTWSPMVKASIAKRREARELKKSQGVL